MVGAQLGVHTVARTTVAEKTPNIGVLYPSGWGNLGDEAILQATFASLRARWPNASLKGFTLHPERTAANHGVHAEPLTGINRHLFGAPLGEGPLLVRASRSVARRTRNVPLVGRLTERFCELLATIVFEAVSVRRAWRWLRSADLVLASGGGQLDAVWGGTWGQPYALARWAWLARRARVPFALFSVGYGGAATWLGRLFLRYAVNSAVYCSVRDAGSATLTKQLGVKRDLPIVPDLAFGLPPVGTLPPRRPGRDIGISPMVYLRPGSWPIENSLEYRRLIAMWAEVVTVTVRNGDRVHLFVSSPSDMTAVRDVVDLLESDTREGCTVLHHLTPNALLDFFGGLDVIISSRLHGVLLGIVAAKPVLALSHERKVAAVMRDAGVGDFCIDLTSASVDQITATLHKLTADDGACVNRMREYVASAGVALSKQDDMLPRLLKVGR